jgi:type III secretory pathway component EscV
MKKQLLISIAQNHIALNVSAIAGIVSLISMLVLPFFGLFLLPFLAVIFAVVSLVFMAQFEAQLESDLKEAKSQLGLSIFTDNKTLLNKCLSVYSNL